MENKKSINFFFAIFTLIIGKALYNQFDFDSLKFENPALAIIYTVVLVFFIYILVKKNKIPPKK
jgi:hypothetical protein